MFFKKLVEQHRVYGFVADGIDLALGITGDQVRVHLRHFLGHQSKLRDACLIQLAFVMESHRAQGKQRLTNIAHLGNVSLESARGEKHTELAVIVHVTGTSTKTNRLACDTSYITTIAYVGTRGTDTDNIISRGDIVASPLAQGGVGIAHAVRQGVNTDRRIAKASCI